jgi:hypothetical protein
LFTVVTASSEGRYVLLRSSVGNLAWFEVLTVVSVCTTLQPRRQPPQLIAPLPHCGMFPGRRLF